MVSYKPSDAIACQSAPKPSLRILSVKTFKGCFVCALRQEAASVCCSLGAEVTRLGNAAAQGNCVKRSHIVALQARGDQVQQAICSVPKSYSLYLWAQHALMAFPNVQRPSRAQGRIHWYTSMVGKKATLREVRAALQRRRCPALRTTQLCQGRTSRWAIAWSWAADMRAAAAPLPRGGPALAAAATAAAAAASGPARCAPCDSIQSESYLSQDC